MRIIGVGCLVQKQKYSISLLLYVKTISSLFIPLDMLLMYYVFTQLLVWYAYHKQTIPPHNWKLPDSQTMLNNKSDNLFHQNLKYTWIWYAHLHAILHTLLLADSCIIVNPNQWCAKTQTPYSNKISLIYIYTYTYRTVHTYVLHKQVTPPRNCTLSHRLWGKGAAHHYYSHTMPHLKRI